MPPSAIEPSIPTETIKAKLPDSAAAAATPIATNGAATSTSPRYTVLEQPSRTGRKLRVIVIGAGASALNFAHDVDTTSSLDVDLVCYEKNAEIGGTWFENKYPGCACDIPSVLYQYSWAPSAEWSS